MRFLITIPSATGTDAGIDLDLLASLTRFAKKNGLTLDFVEPTTAPAPPAKPGRKSSGLPKGQRNFKCHTSDPAEGCVPTWVGNNTTDKAEWGAMNLLCPVCHAEGCPSTANPTWIAKVIEECESVEADALATSTEWGDDE